MSDFFIQGSHDRDVRLAAWLNEHSTNEAFTLGPGDENPYSGVDLMMEAGTMIASTGPFGTRAIRRDGAWMPLRSAESEIVGCRARAAMLAAEAATLREHADALEARMTEAAK